MALTDGKADAKFYTQWRHSPLSDEYLERMAEAAVDALNLGKGRGTDFLGVSFSTLDLVGPRVRAEQPRSAGRARTASI